ncbi:ectoine/hydroxyectoine ABC transporter substrate-binding protein EhuB [Nitratidesulfovibrio liaohensis]|uniref:Ectoine/hydroxyectoine ABC transporter substrate-binding protein EhuB n=1 Tax=Nitratidesulfovibrio liaohensis TaxID=2604158 RepID=A0ABY9R0J4_9BACT|nr:ectoine/hydroxyectoine ABC transporter substrate-binding protein EhuB [Nitratidesulfovibrio liaohensis]WMW64702.1 ectoine/hydroxyectoine ABC transporter substrate-binding protein EhuB [Nitratidesulfovibrio liaohensis]
MPRLPRPAPSLLGVIALACAVTTLIYALMELPDPDDTAWSGGTIRVGYALEPPYAYRTPEGTVTGEAPEVARAALTRAGITRVRWVLGDFNALIPDLLAGHIDMIAAGMFVTPDRAARVAFSLPTSSVGQGLLVRRGNPRGLHDYASLAERNEVTLAVLDGAVEHRQLLLLGMPAERLFPVADAHAGMTAVRKGRVDGLALSGPTVTLLARQHPDELEAARPFTQPVIDGKSVSGLCAFAFRKEDAPLVDRVNEQLRAFIGTPEHLALVQPFGFDGSTLPPWAVPDRPDKPAGPGEQVGRSPGL